MEKSSGCGQYQTVLVLKKIRSTHALICLQSRQNFNKSKVYRIALVYDKLDSNSVAKKLQGSHTKGQSILRAAHSMHNGSSTLIQSSTDCELQ